MSIQLSHEYLKFKFSKLSFLHPYPAIFQISVDGSTILSIAQFLKPY